MLPEEQQRILRDLGRARAAVQKAARLLEALKQDPDLHRAQGLLAHAWINISMAYKRRKMPGRPGRK